MNPGDKVRCGPDTAVVARDLGNRIQVRGMVGNRGPFVQHWHEDGTVEVVERVGMETARREEQKRIDQSIGGEGGQVGQARDRPGRSSGKRDETGNSGTVKLNAIQSTDPNIDVRDRPRLAGQNAAILKRLQQGPATNEHLAAISLKYTSRISDLRKAGYRIECERLDRGAREYRLT